MTPWLATSTFYGNWLPGDPRGSVTSVRERRPGDPDIPFRIEHDIPGTDYDKGMPGLQRSAAERLKGPPVLLEPPQAEALLAQFQETARIRQWPLHAVSIMPNHVHWTVEVHPEFDKPDILKPFKEWASKRLNRLFGKRMSETWWTEKGSCRPLKELPAANFYVLHRQPWPLVVWSALLGRIDPSESHPDHVHPGEYWDPRVPFVPPGVGSQQRAAGL